MPADRICLKSASQLNALVNRFLGNKEKKVLINIFVFLNFNYCPLVWMLANAKSYHKIEAIQKRALCFTLNDYEIFYKDLLERSVKPSINLRRTRTLCIEICKAINNLNPGFMKNLFKVFKTNRAQKQQHQLNVEILKHNQASFGPKSLRLKGPRVWNALSFHSKSKENL